MEKERLKYDIQKMYERLDSIEELLKLSLAANLLDDMAIMTEEKQGKLLNEDISIQLSMKGIIENEHYKMFDKMVVELRCERKITVRDIIEVREQIAKEMKEAVPLFCFDRLNGMQKKRMLEEKVSFKIMNKEIHIVGV